MFLGFVSALVGRKREEDAAGRASLGPGSLDPISARRIDELAGAVVEVQARLDAVAPPVAAPPRLDAVTARLAALEKRVEQIAGGAPVDQILAAVEHMVSDKIAGLDERLTDQLQAVELLRSASVQTDALLQKLLYAVESLGSQTEKAAAAESEGTPGPQKEYPAARGQAES